MSDVLHDPAQWSAVRDRSATRTAPDGCRLPPILHASVRQMCCRPALDWPLRLDVGISRLQTDQYKVDVFLSSRF